MKLVTFRDGNGTRIGFLRGEQVLDAIAALGAGAEREKALFAEARTFIAAGEPALALANQLIGRAEPSAWRPLASVKLLAPLLPSTIILAGSNYRAHIKEKQNTPLSGREPEFFLKTADCVVGPNDPIVHDPRLTTKLDCETELAIVIGKPGRHIPVEDALLHVFGYTIINDVTARDRQVRTTPEGFTWYELGRGKAFDSSAPLGPCITTTDEIPDPQALMLRTRINGELRQCSSTADMIWDCAALIHFFSINFTLRPGMVISTGTPAGTAWSTDTSLGGKWQDIPGLVPARRYCEPGDAIESEIEGIGVLRNHVVAGQVA